MVQFTYAQILHHEKTIAYIKKTVTYYLHLLEEDESSCDIIIHVSCLLQFQTTTKSNNLNAHNLNYQINVHPLYDRVMFGNTICACIDTQVIIHQGEVL